MSKQASETGINAVYQLLRDEFAIDFSHYKPNTVLRRIDRRLQLNRSLDLEQYIGQLRADRAELNSLYKDLLIGVTRFFRDPQLFERLSAEIIPDVLSRVAATMRFVPGWRAAPPARKPIRWPCCCTKRCRPRAADHVKIFASDVHRHSLEVASLGVYDQSALAEVSTERLARYFVKQSDSYQVSQDLRKMIVFAPHNVIKDAPFTRLDLISCRNLLIYLQPHAQKKALSLFHFGLKPGGLILGPSESPARSPTNSRPSTAIGKSIAAARRRLPTDMRVMLSPLPPSLVQGGGVRAARPGISDPNLIKAYDELLASFPPACSSAHSASCCILSAAPAGF